MSSPSTGLEGSNDGNPVGWVYTGNERREWVWHGHRGDPHGTVAPYPGYPRFERLLPVAQRSENARRYPRGYPR